MSALDTDVDAPIRVQVTPSQTAYFSGEPFSVIITFTNTRSLTSTPTPGPSRLGHKRAAHSISSAPIARPPTSPAGQPRIPTTSHTFRRDKWKEREEGKPNSIQRKRLIGRDVGKDVALPQGRDVLPDLIEQRRKRLLAKSLSLTISPGDLEAELSAGVLRQAQVRYGQSDSQSSSSSSIPSPLSRSESLSLSSNHPHARKQSVLDGQVPVPLFTTTSVPLKSPLSTSISAPAQIGNTSTSNVSTPTNSVPPSPSIPSTPSASASASNSAFSIALDPIEELSPASSSPFTPSSPPGFISSQYALYPDYSYPTSPATPNPVMPSPSIAIQSPSPSKKRPEQTVNGIGTDRSSNEIGLGLPSNPGLHRGRPTPLNWNSSKKPETPRKPNEESILYSYVQLKGSVVVSSPIPSSSLNKLRSTLLRGSVLAIGGGSMDISSSLSGGSLAGLNTPSLGGLPAGQRHRRSPSLAGLVLTGLGLSSSPSHAPVSSTSAPQLNEVPKGPTPIDSVPRNGQQHRRSVSARPELKSASSSTWLWGGSPAPTSASDSYDIFPEEDSATIPARIRATSANGMPFASSKSPSARPPPTRTSSSSFSRMFGRSPSDDPHSTPLMSGPNSRWGEQEQTMDPETPLPTFEVQPAMLSVDGILGPGQSQSFKYTLNLPSNLPPTFLGQHLQFSYELVVGICRSVGTGYTGSVSKVMKVPIRIYNNVTVGRAPVPYDLLWPAAKRKRQLAAKGHRRGGAVITNQSTAEDEGEVEEIKTESGPTIGASLENGAQGEKEVQKGHWKGLGKAEPKGMDGEDQVRDYAHRLLSGGVLAGAEDAGVELGDGELKPVKCGEAVEILTRVQKKISYDVNKSGVKVAVLTFSKSAFRLGETVFGVVELNERQSRTRVLKLSVHLETCENLPPYLCSPQYPNLAKRIHGSHHCSFVLGSLRTTFSLNIPSDASPAFQVFVDPSSAGTPSYPHVNGEGSPAVSSFSTDAKKPGGLEWKVRLSLLVAIASESAEKGTEGVLIKGLVRDGERGEWGCGWVAPSHRSGVLQKLPKPKSPPHSLGSGSGKGFIRSWTSFIIGDDSQSEADSLSVSSFDDGEDNGYDGIKPDRHGGVGIGVDFSGCGRGGEAEWEEIKTEIIECEVPIRVWPGNTAFRSADVLFDV